jgi:hypothetical protein
MILVANSSVLLPSDVARVRPNQRCFEAQTRSHVSARSEKSRRDTIIATYRSCNGNVVRTARELGCHGIPFTANSGEWGLRGANLAGLVATHQRREKFGRLKRR